MGEKHRLTDNTIEGIWLMALAPLLIMVGVVTILSLLYMTEDISSVVETSRYLLVFISLKYLYLSYFVRKIPSTRGE